MSNLGELRVEGSHPGRGVKLLREVEGCPGEAWCRVQGSGLRVRGLGFRVRGLGFRV